MKQNYQLLLDKVISQHSGALPSLLLHSCCGPCSSYVLEYLSKHFDITVFFYNPNIYPEAEYFKRLDTQKQLLAKMPFENPVSLIEGNYDPETYLNAIRGQEEYREGGARCSTCFTLRLDKTAELAKTQNFDYFATTLTVSPHKNAQIINTLGYELSEKHGVSWLPSDFKKREGYKRSIELSAEYGLHRQDYCGCSFAMNY